MRTRQGETICLGEWIRPASADFPPAGGVWGGMRAGFGFANFFFRHKSYETKVPNFCSTNLESSSNETLSCFVVSRFLIVTFLSVKESKSTVIQ